MRCSAPARLARAALACTACKAGVACGAAHWDRGDARCPVPKECPFPQGVSMLERWLPRRPPPGRRQPSSPALLVAQVVDANRMASTPYDLSFRVERTDEVVCEKTLTADDLANFRRVRPEEAGPTRSLCRRSEERGLQALQGAAPAAGARCPCACT